MTNGPGRIPPTFGDFGNPFVYLSLTIFYTLASLREESLSADVKERKEDIIDPFPEKKTLKKIYHP